ncbi:MAG: hypothetical protein GY950_06050 [bacterium]|nr:hypothetical protein [bacterium]
MEFDSLASIAVREPEKTEEAVIRDENRRKQFKYRKRKRKQEDDEEPVEETEILVDLQA